MANDNFDSLWDQTQAQRTGKDFDTLWNETAAKPKVASSDFESLWNETQPAHPAQQSPHSLTLFGQAVKGINDVVGAVEKSRPMGFDLSGLTQQARDAAQQRFSGKANWRTRQYAGMSGLLGLGDSLVNFPLVGAQQLAGVPQAKRVHADMQGAFESLPYVQQEKQNAPDFYNSFAGTAQAVAPLPTRGAGLAEHLAGGVSPFARAAVRDFAGTTAGKIADAALTQGAVQGANLAGDVAKQTNEVDPRLFAAGAGLGGAFGGAFEGAVPAAKKIFGGIAKNVKQASPMALGAKQNALGRAASSGLLDGLEGEDAQVAAQMLAERQAQSTEPKISAVQAQRNQLPYPQYLDFSQAPAEAPQLPHIAEPSRFERRGLERSLAPIVQYARAKSSVDGPMGQLAQAIIEDTVKKPEPPAGEFRRPIARDSQGKILKGYLQSQKDANVHLHPDSEAGMMLQKIAETKVRMQERELHMDMLSRAWREQAKVPLEAKHISLSGRVQELESRLADAPKGGKKPIISELSKAKKELAIVQSQLAGLNNDKAVRVGDIVFKPARVERELTSAARAEHVEPVREGLLTPQERELLTRGGPYNEQEQKILAGIKRKISPSSLHVDSARPEDFARPADLGMVHEPEKLKQLAQEHADDEQSWVYFICLFRYISGKVGTLHGALGKCCVGNLSGCCA